MKADGERSLKALRDAVARCHGGIIVPEVCARGESESYGVAHQATQAVAEFVRVLKEQIEVKTKVKLSQKIPSRCGWYGERLSFLRSVWLGRTAVLRMRDDDEGDDAECQWCRWAREFFSNRFGQAKITRTCSRAKTGKGHNLEATEVLIGTPSGVVRAFSYRRRREGSRWNADMIKNSSSKIRPDLESGHLSSEPAHVDEAVPNQLQGKSKGQDACGSCRTCLRNMVLLRDVKGVGTSRLVFKAHEIILKRVDSKSWRP